MKKLLKGIFLLILTVLTAVVCLLTYLTLTEYNPEDVEKVEISAAGDTRVLQSGQSLRLLSWNIGYGGLGEGSDFFMDGGTGAQDADEHTVRRYLEGIKQSLYSGDDAPEIMLLQEVDLDSAHSYGIDETKYLAGANSAFALNYKCGFVPMPFPPIGRVECGVLTTGDYKIEKAERIALPCPFTWPLSTANLKRCLLVSYLPIEGSDKKLVLVNLHLEAYDDGEGKIAQTKMLKDFIQAEYEKGNYVIAGGDFNQSFPGGVETYPIMHPELWTPGTLDASMLPEGWTLAYDLETPTCRLLNQPYDPADTENTIYYVIDGLILSPNVTLDSVQTLDYGFENSDHNPVAVSVTLG